MGQSTIDLVKEIVNSYGYHEPKEGQLVAAISYIEKTYSTNESKVSRAFQAAAENRLGLELKTVFSVKEIIRVMHGYEANKKPSYTRQEDVQPTSEELTLIEKAFKKGMVREFEKFKEGKEYCLTPDFCYLYLENKGLIEPGSDKTEETIKLATQLGKSQLKEKYGIFHSKNILAQFEKAHKKDDHKALFIVKCRTVAFDRFFNGMVEKNTDFEQLLTTI